MFFIGLVNFKSCIRSLSSWLTFNLSFQCGFGTSRLQGDCLFVKVLCRGWAESEPGSVAARRGQGKDLSEVVFVL